MSADILREAAALMRTRAEAATPGPYTRYVTGSQVEIISDEDDLIYRRLNDMQALGDAEHIASWHPTVALSVADWLDLEARQLVTELARALADYGDGIDCAAYEAGWFTNNPALAVARAYLGTDPQETP